jgi:hypothetical protein
MIFRNGKSLINEGTAEVNSNMTMKAYALLYGYEMQVYQAINDVGYIEIRFHTPEIIDHILLRGEKKLWYMDMAYVTMYNEHGTLVYVSDVGMEKSSIVPDSLGTEYFSIRCM